jgi:hypothetical protein
MRALAIAVVAALGLTMALANAADIGVGASRPYAAADERYHADCGWRGVPFRGDDYGPRPNSEFFGPLGYHCLGGTYAYFPDYPRCRVVRIHTQDGWREVTRCN